MVFFVLGRPKTINLTPNLLLDVEKAWHEEKENKDIIEN